MAEVTTTPIAVSYRDEGFLAAGITSTDASLTVGAIYKWVSGVKTKQGFDSTGGFAEITDGKRIEVVSFGAKSVNATTKVTTLSDLRRGLSQTSVTADFASGTGLRWDKGAKIRVIDYQEYIHNGAFKDKANTFSEDQTVGNGKKVIFGGSSAYVWTENSGTDLKFKDANNSERTLTQLSSLSGTNDKVKVSSNDTTEDYLFNKLAAGAGITVTETNDGGNEDATIAAVNTVATGHTGLSTVTSGGLLVGAGTSNMTVIGPGTTSQVPVSNGTTIVMGTVPAFDKTVALNVSNSSTRGVSSTADFDFDNHTYSIPSSDLVAGVAYEFEAHIDLTHGAGDIEIFVKLGSNKAITLGDFTPPGGRQYILRGTVYGTEAAGASAAVRASAIVQTQNNSDQDGATDYESNNFATNTGLTLQFGGAFRTSNASNSMIMRVSKIRKIATSAF